MFPSVSSLRASFSVIASRRRGNPNGNAFLRLLRRSRSSQRHGSEDKVCRILSNIVSPVYLNEISKFEGDEVDKRSLTTKICVTINHSFQ